jgi:hypothetical protein
MRFLIQRHRKRLLLGFGMSVKLNIEQARNARWFDIYDVDGNWLATSQGVNCFDAISSLLSNLDVVDHEKVKARIGVVEEANGFGEEVFGANNETNRN